MPTPNKNESEVDFVNRCIPIVIADKTAKDGAQGAAICHSIYREHKKKQNTFAPGSPIPASAMNFECALEFGDNGENAKTSPIKMLARAFALVHPFWGKVEHDFAGMTHKGKIPLDYCHDPKELVGYANKFDIGGDGLQLSGALTPYKDDRASEIVAKCKMGVPYQASIDFRGPVTLEEVGQGHTSQVNGHDFAGPGIIVRKWMLRGCAVCPHGADSETSSMVFSGDESYEAELIASESLTPTQEPIMATPAAAEGAKPVEAIQAEGAKPVEATKTEAATEPKQFSVPAVEVKPVEAAKTESAADVAKKFLAAYGMSGLKWMAEGKSFEEARDLFTKELQAENADLKAKVTAAKAQMGAAAPVAASEPAPEATKPQKTIPAGLTPGERAIFTQIRMAE
jgi:hypothetical protein